MKKHRTARLLSVILAVVMIFGSISVGVTAAYAPYLDDALTDNYNTIDQVTLTEAQHASLLLDKVDRALADANIVIDVSVVGTLNLDLQRDWQHPFYLRHSRRSCGFKNASR